MPNIRSKHDTLETIHDDSITLHDIFVNEFKNFYPQFDKGTTFMFD